MSSLISRSFCFIFFKIVSKPIATVSSLTTLNRNKYAALTGYLFFSFVWKIFSIYKHFKQGRRWSTIPAPRSHQLDCLVESERWLAVGNDRGWPVDWSASILRCGRDVMGLAPPCACLCCGNYIACPSFFPNMQNTDAWIKKERNTNLITGYKNTGSIILIKGKPCHTLG